MNIFQHTNYTQRATAHNHMQPYERICAFVSGMIGRCSHDIKELQNEIKMWQEPEVQQLLGADECNMKCDQVTSLIQSLQAELDGWMSMNTRLGVCETCGGSGTYYDTSCESVKCDKCKGSGRKLWTPPPTPKTVAAAAPAENVSWLAVGRKFR